LGKNKRLKQFLVLSMLATFFSLGVPAYATDPQVLLVQVKSVESEVDSIYKPLRIFYVFVVKQLNPDKKGDEKIGNSGISLNSLSVSFIGAYDGLEKTRTELRQLEMTLESKTDLSESDLAKMSSELSNIQKELPKLDAVLNFVMDLTDGYDKFVRAGTK